MTFSRGLTDDKNLSNQSQIKQGLRKLKKTTNLSKEFLNFFLQNIFNH
jgi:hypothetical protein